MYKFLDDEKRILEEEKRGLEQDKRDLESALQTAQDELRAISENMAVEDEDFDKQRLINVLEGVVNKWLINVFNLLQIELKASSDTRQN